MEQLLIDLLNNFDFTSLADLDWADISAYSAVLLTVGTGVYASSKMFMSHVWGQLEKPLGFIISTLVVVSLWYAIIRVHVSVSFNLDKEMFDDLLWLSAITFTPYYLARYELIETTFTVIFRALELALDLMVFSWFEEKAKSNRIKWKTRFTSWRLLLGNYFYALTNSDA